MGKAVKNCQKHGENYEFLRAKRTFFESESVICYPKTSKSLTSLFVKERFALVTLL